MISNFVVRDIKDEDVADVISLWNATRVAKPWNKAIHEIAFARSGKHSTVLVAHSDEKLAAVTLVGCDGEHGWVYYVATDPERQRQGFGRRIMEAAEAWLVARGATQLELRVRDDSDAVHSFYERLGFKNTATEGYQKSIGPAEKG